MAVVAWLLAVSTVVVAGAMLLAQLQFMGLVPTSLSELAATVSNTGPGGGSTPDNVDKTYCYASVLTQARDRSPSDPPAGPHCFTVSSSTGTFTSVFALPSTGHDGPDHDVLPGHVIPGLWDGHGHILHLGELLHSVDLFGSSSPAEMVARVEAYYEEAAAGGVGSRDDWLRGLGWDQMAMGRMPTAADLAASPALKDLYVMLDRVDVHCLLASAPILALLPNPLPDVPGGEIVRDPVTGEATGVFCDNAMDLVYALWPRPDARRKKQFTRSAMRALNAVGIVGVHDAGVIAPQELDVWREMVGEKDDGWTVRVYAMLECAARNTFGSCADEVAAMGLPERRDLRSPDVPSAHGWLMARSVKLFADGALGSWGSAMLEPYNDRPESRGALLAEPDDLVGVARAWAGAGFQVNIHAIGDRANRVAVDALLAALQESCGGGDPGRQEQQKVMVDDKGLDGLTVSTNRTRECQASRFRHRIEHAQIVHPDDQARILAAGIVPSIQPTHATSDMSYAELRLGRTRVETEAYRMRTFLRGLAVRSNETSTASDDNTHRQPHPLVLGSDFPVEPPSPLAGIYAAVTRRNPKTGHGVNGPGDHSGWYVESEGITADEALAGFTAGPAEAAFLETKAGVIAPGAFADWVVLEESWDAYALGGDEMMERLREGREVRETWVGGRMVYARDDLK